MSDESAILIRFGTPADIPVLRSFERMYFPAVTGQHHAGYLFDNEELATLTLTEEVVAKHRSWTVVAEVDGDVVGFAAAVPSRFTGSGDLDPSAILLMYLAVDPAHRRKGIATALMADIEGRAVAARQNVMVAHVPADQHAVYEKSGWIVYGDRRGFGWLPFISHLRGDVADPHLGFPHMAAKVLRSRALRTSFDFPVVHDAPTYDAAAELSRIIDAGGIDIRDLDRDTLRMVNATRSGPTPPLYPH